VLEETTMILPDCKKRLNQAYAELQALVAGLPVTEHARRALQTRPRALIRTCF
jgi:hypothetical protein